MRRFSDRRHALVLAIVATLAGFGTDSWAQTLIGQYSYQQAADPISDRDRSQVSTVELAAEGSARLTWRCDGPDVEVFLLAEKIVTDTNAGVEWRVDRGAPSPYTSWSASRQDGRVFAPPAIVPLFTDRARAGDSLRIRLWDYRGVPEDFEFSLDGLTEALDRLDCSTPAPNRLMAMDPSGNALWIYGTAGASEAAATLRLECERGEPGIELVETGASLREVIEVDFDRAPTRTDYWGPNDLSGPTGALLQSFLARLAASDSLGMEFRTVSNEKLSVRFDVSGLSRAYEALDCGGSLPAQHTLLEESVESTSGSRVGQDLNGIVESQLWDSAVEQVSDPVLRELHDLFYTIGVVRGSSLLEDHVELMLLVETLEKELDERNIGFVAIRPRVDGGASEETVYLVGNGVSAPILLSRVEPEYTDEAKAAGIEGKVVMDVVITKDGSVDAVQVVESLESGLDERAIAAVRQWTFRPSVREGQPVNVRARIDIQFTIH